MTDHDLLRFDVTGVQQLRSAAITASRDLAADHAALDPLLDDASALLGIDQTIHLVQLRRVRVALDEMAVDITIRLSRVLATLVNARSIDGLSARITRWGGSENDPRLDQLVIDRDDLVRALIGGGAGVATAVIRLVNAGVPVLAAVDEVAQRERETRITALMDAEGLDRSAAVDHIARLDASVLALIDAGIDPSMAVATVSISDSLDLDLDLAVHRAGAKGIGVIDVLGHMAVAENLGLSIDESISIDALRSHFATFDNARGAWRDGRVSRDDLEFVIANPTRFAPAQIVAAEAVLDSPELFTLLDTAAATTDVLSGSRFGDPDDGDGLVSLDDLQAFVVKAQLNHVLGEYADQIDVAADPGGTIDGSVSRADLETFLSETPDLPAEVRAAASTMLDAGMFDRSWLETHRDELALGAAVVAGAVAAGVVITMSAGTATPLVIVGMGAVAGSTAGGATTLAVNALDDDLDPFDEVVANSVRGGLLGATTAGLPLGFSSVGSATTLPAALAAAAGLTSDAATITAVGGVDILFPESIEDDIHSSAGAISEVTGAAGAFKGAING